MLEDFSAPETLVAETHLTLAQVRLALADREALPGRARRSDTREPAAPRRSPRPSPFVTVENDWHVRLLIDARLSPRRTGSVLERSGHDVLCLAADPALRALDDPNALELTFDEGRVLITRNSRGFAPLRRQWNEAGQYHVAAS